MTTASNDLWFVIVNPVAGNGLGRRQWPVIETLLQQLGFSYSVAFTESKGHGIGLAREAVEKGYRRLMAVGGDGTGHEVVNGILQQREVPSTEVTYLQLPVGTGNDWLRMYGLPHSHEALLRLAAIGNTTLQDVGTVSYYRDGVACSRYFYNVAGMAYDAFVARQLDAERGVVTNKMLYLFMVFRCLFSYRLTRARVTFDGQTVDERFYLINAGICRYSGNNMQLVPHAKPDDGLLALTLAGPMSKAAVIRNTYRLYNGTLGEHPLVSLHQAREVRVEPAGGQPTLLEADGEFLGETPVTFGILDKALKVIVP